MKTAGKKNRSTMEGKIIDSYKLYADAEKCFYKFWLKGSLIEMVRIYIKNDFKMVYKRIEERNVVGNK